MRLAFLGCCFILCSVAFADPLCCGHERSKSFCAGWESLQQIRSLIPERIWDQEFQIRVDRKAFMKAMKGWTRKDVSSCMAMGENRQFFLRSTMSGENVRILDQYQEFQWSPFWKNPPMKEQLCNLENQTMKEVQ